MSRVAKENSGDFSGVEGRNLMAEKKIVRTRNVAFRVTGEEYEQVCKLSSDSTLRRLFVYSFFIRRFEML